MKSNENTIHILRGDRFLQSNTPDHMNHLNFVVNATDFLDEENSFYAEHPDFNQIGFIGYKKKCCDPFNLTAYIEHVKNSEKSQFIFVPLQDIENNRVFNGPILHTDKSCEYIYNAVQEGDSCVLEISSVQSTNNKLRLSDCPQIFESSFMDSLRFVFQRLWHSPIYMEIENPVHAILLFMMRNAKPDESLAIYGDQRSWSGPWKRLLQNLGIEYAGIKLSDENKVLSKKLADILVQVNLNNLALKEINERSDIIPQSLLRQFESLTA